MPLDSDPLGDLIATIRRYVQERLIPNEGKVADEDRIPPEIVDEMRRLGFFGLTVPEEYGGLGLTMEEEALVGFELGHASPAFRSVFGTNNGIGSQAIVLAGTEEQKQRYLPLLASGELIGSFALTEPEAGSDAAAVSTRAVRDGDGYVLDGTKRFITNAPHAGLFTVMARTDPATKGAAGVSAFLVEAGIPGIGIGPKEKKMGQRGAPVADVVFTECRVPPEALLGGVEGQGFRVAMRVLDRGRLAISASFTGFAERILDDLVAYAIQRQQFGRPIAEFQLIQAMIADSKADLVAARAMVLEASRAHDRGEDISLLAACCKMFTSESLGRVADRNVQVHGGAGYVADYAAERHYRDARLARLYEGTTQIQQLVIARNVIRAAKAALG
ncbi:MAG: acyl-CoA dehydrogenase [Actinobacteria bacterium RBG_16_70_17]|nr:MAG: acyl-CoA dehydrogenase [Actinobacteria bacterium RBG_16_70_17]